MKRTLFTILLLAGCLLTQAQQTDYTSILNVSYYPESERVADEYIGERCMLDLYYPDDIKGFPTVIWFHGGGLTGGNKFIPEALKEKGMAVVAVNYRLYPKINEVKRIVRLKK